MPRLADTSSRELPLGSTSRIDCLESLETDIANDFDGIGLADPEGRSGGVGRFVARCVTYPVKSKQPNERQTTHLPAHPSTAHRHAPENSNKPCDTGSNIASISADFPHFDFSTIDPIFPDASPGTPYAFTRSANAARGQSCLQNLHARPEKVIAVVSHAGFLRTAVTHRRFANADYRIFTFQEASHGKLELREDGETDGKGGAMGRSRKGVFRAEEWDFPKENVEV